jgi:hypothetical protein
MFRGLFLETDPPTGVGLFRKAQLGEAVTWRVLVSGPRFDDCYKVANVFHLAHFRGRKFDFERLLDGEHQPNVGQAIPTIHVFGRQSWSRGNKIVIKDALEDFC